MATDRELMEQARATLRYARAPIAEWSEAGELVLLDVLRRLDARLAQPEPATVECTTCGAEVVRVAGKFDLPEASEQAAPAKTRIELTEIPDVPPAPQGVPMFTPPPKLLPIGSVPAKADGQWPEHIIRQWDHWRQQIARGDTSSAPRDWFESLAPAPVAKAEPVAWYGVIEGSIHHWRSRQMNADGERLSLSQVLSTDQIEDLIDFLCDSLAPPAPDTAHLEQALTEWAAHAGNSDGELLRLRQSHALLVEALQATIQTFSAFTYGHIEVAAMNDAKAALAAAKEAK